MREIFLEEVASNNNYSKEKFEYNLFTILSLVSAVLLGVWVFLSIFYLLALIKGNAIIKAIIIVLPIILFLTFAIIFRKIRYNFCVEYDYTLVDDSIRVDKVIKGVKRFPVVDFSSSDIEKIGKFGSDTYLQYFGRPEIVVNFLSANDNPSIDKDFYYIVVNLNAEKLIFVFECTKNFIANILRSTRISVLESDFQ